MIPSRRVRQVRTSQDAARPARPPQSDLQFCAIFQVSIPSAEIERGDARRTPRGRLFCGVCVGSTPQERDRRRAELEAEFADDAPVPVPVRSGRSPGAEEAVTQTDLRPAPAHEVAFLAARVGELERAAFRTQARITDLEERLAEALRRLG